MVFVFGWPLALALTVSVGCGFTIAPSGGDDGIPEGRRITVTDDTEPEFADNGGLIDGVVAARGALEPHAYVVGGLKARGFAGNHVNDTRTYDEVVTAAGTQLGFGYRHVPADWSLTPANRPRGIGILGTDQYTILFTGEILLPQGTVKLLTNADDRVIIQIALDGVTWGPRLFSHQADATLDITVPVAGWYPFRAAYGQAGGDADWSLSYTQLGAGKTTIDATRLRARVTAEPGLVASAFEGKALMAPRGESGVTTVDENYGVGPPSHDLPIIVSDQYSLRFAGQVRIDTPGAYTFTVDIGAEAFDVYRLWIDGVVVANVWPTMTDKLTATLDLSAGWHDLLLDYGEEISLARVQLRLAGPGITDGVIAPERLRPAVAFAHTAPFVAFTNLLLNDATIAGPGVTIVPMPVTAPTGATIAASDYGLGIVNQRFSDLTIDVLDCSGARTLPPITTQELYYYYSAVTSCAGSNVVPATPWAWRVTDTVVGNDLTIIGLPTLYNPMLVQTYAGGDRTPFAPAYEFVSSPKRTTGSIGLGTIDVTADLRGAMLMIEVRSGADPAALAAAPWVPVANGAVPAVEGSEWAQYRIAVTSDGWKLASIDKVDLTYVVPDE